MSNYLKSQNTHLGFELNPRFLEIAKQTEQNVSMVAWNIIN